MNIISFFQSIFKHLCPPDIRRLSHDNDLDGLERVLADQDYGPLRLEAAEALGMLRGEKAAIVLVRFIDDPYAGPAAAKALALLAESYTGALNVAFTAQRADVCQSLSTLLTRKNSPLCRPAALALGRLGSSQATSILLQHLYTCEDTDTRADLLLAIGISADQNPQIVADAIPDSNMQADEAVFGIIAKCKSSRRVRALLSLASKASGKRLNSLCSFIKETPNTDVLTAAYEDVGNPAIRSLAAEVLRHVGGEAATGVFLDDLCDSDKQAQASNSLTGLGQAIVPLILNRLTKADTPKEPYYQVLRNLGDTACASVLRFVSTKSPGECGPPLVILRDVFPDQAMTGLLGLLQGRNGNAMDYHKGKIIVEALDKMGWQPTAPLECAWHAVTHGDWATCAKIGDPALVPLLAALDSQISAISEEAQSTLNRLPGGMLAVHARRLKDKNTDTRMRAVDALARIPCKESLMLLIDALGAEPAKTLPVPFRAALKMISSGVGDDSMRTKYLGLMAARMATEAARYIEISAMKFDFFNRAEHAPVQLDLDDFDELRGELLETSNRCCVSFGDEKIKRSLLLSFVDSETIAALVSLERSFSSDAACAGLRVAHRLPPFESPDSIPQRIKKLSPQGLAGAVHALCDLRATLANIRVEDHLQIRNPGIPSGWSIAMAFARITDIENSINTALSK